ncbi:hypothetical protein K883_05139, partial [Mycobacterium sp. TKK-01-0059]
MSDHDGRRSFLAHTIRRLSVPLVLLWLALAAVTNIAVPNLEAVAEAHTVGMSSNDAPSLQAMKRMGKLFHEFDSDNSAMVLLEGD